MGWLEIMLGKKTWLDLLILMLAHMFKVKMFSLAMKTGIITKEDRGIGEGMANYLLQVQVKKT